MVSFRVAVSDAGTGSYGVMDSAPTNLGLDILGLGYVCWDFFKAEGYRPVQRTVVGMGATSLRWLDTGQWSLAVRRVVVASRSTCVICCEMVPEQDLSALQALNKERPKPLLRYSYYKVSKYC